MNKPKKKSVLLIILFAFLLFHLLFTILPSILYPHSLGGNFGIRPRSNICFGITISNETALKIFPKGDFTFNILLNGFEYRVNPDRMLEDVCIGQDIWYGE